MSMIKDLAQVNAELQEQKERVDTVDFKMVTFSLAGKDYGVDIMNVKEIAKASKFTYVPNAASFVRGVYNLRGDIIPVIDLRMFFHMPVVKNKDSLENMLILRIEDRVYGTIVDKIDKVVGINAENIQPPHPIFGDINIKFISGVVEKQGNLYIILDVMRIFTQSEEDKKKPRGSVVDNAGAFSAPAVAEALTALDSQKAVSDSALDFIKENLPILYKFHPSSINETWVHQRFTEWSSTRTGEELQIKNAEEAAEYISGFASQDTDRFWRDNHAALVKDILPDNTSSIINVWNVGCGRGYETFSFACILRSRYPGGRIKIWANDNDIMAVSQAPNMTFEFDDLPEYCRPFVNKGRNGYSFNQAIKDSIVFEYHDVLHDSPLPDLDIILIRDVLSFLPEADQHRVIQNFGEKLKPGGLLIVGKNEVMPGGAWNFTGREPVSAFTYI